MGMYFGSDKGYSEVIDNIVYDLYNNDEISFITTNFIRRVHRNIFLDRKYIIDFERETFHVTSCPFTKFPKLMCNDKHIAQWSTSHIDDNIKYKFMKEDFPLFVKVLSTKYDFNDYALAFLSTYRLVRQQSILHFSEQAKNEFGEYINASICNDTNLAVEQYCNLDFIDHIDESYIGLLACYMIGEFGERKTEEAINFMLYNDTLRNLIEQRQKALEVSNFEKILKRDYNKPIFSINDVDLMTGEDFEHFIVNIFARMGYKANATKRTGDQGLDVIAEKNGVKFGIQAKCYSNMVNNKSIQEIVAGVKYYGCHKAIVITNNYFTKSAIELADANNVILWDRRILKEKIEDVLNK